MKKCVLTIDFIFYIFDALVPGILLTKEGLPLCVLGNS